MDNISHYLSEYGYLFLFIYSFGGGFVALLIAGVLSQVGTMNIYASIGVALAGNYIGDSLLFYITKNNKKMFENMISKNRRKLAYSKKLISKYGISIIFIQKYLYGFKTFVPMAMALTNYNFKKFNIYNIYASILWAVIVGYLSYINGKFLLNIYKEYSNPYYPLIILIVIIVVINYLMNIAIKRAKK